MEKLFLHKKTVLKLLLFMNLKVFFLFMSILPASASIYSQNTKLDVTAENYSLESVFEQIENQSEFTFLYSVDDVDDYLNISVDIKGKTVEEILEKCLDKTSLTFEVEDNLVVVRQKSVDLTPKTVAQEKISITGSVTESSGETLPGVAIVVKGTTTGTVTNINGEFTINANMGDVLVFSFVGMLSQEIVVTSKKVLVVELKVDAANLSEVVVVGFGKQKAESVVGSMSTVKPSELKIASSNLTTALAGRISGIISTQTSGEPGQDNAQFFVRGITTFAQGAGPLILIDGVELSANDLSRLNPDDIESFSVMKDATSTAVYGARGANGVIYVVTKSGVEGKAKINFRLENSFSTNTRLPEIADGVTYMEKYNEATITRNPGSFGVFSDEKIYNTRNKTNPYVFPDVDWQKELIKDWTRNQRFNMSVRGGGKVARYYIAGNYSQDNGILNDDPLGNIENNIKLRKYLLRVNVDFDLTKTTKAVIRVHNTFDEFKGPSVGAGNLFAQTLLTSPVRFPATFRPDENNINTPNILFGNEKLGDHQYYVNPYQQLVSGFTKTSNSLNLVQVEINQDLSEIIDGLKIRFLGNNNRNSWFGLTRNTSPFFYESKLALYDPINNEYELTRLNDDGNRALSFQGAGSSVANVIYGELALDYQKEWGKNTINGLLVGTGREFTTSEAKSLEASLPSRNIGVSGRFTYHRDSKYFAEFNFGYNGSERFAEKNRFGFFPSVGLAWLVSNEGFFEGVNKNFISKLKFKASYGVVGNDRIGDDEDRFFYRSQVTDNAGGYRWGNPGSTRYVSGVGIENYENNAITWETATTANFAMELDMMQDAFKIRAEYFNQERSNILQNRVLPYSMGLQITNKDGSSVRDNVGKASIHGFDLSVDGNKSFVNGAWISVRGTFTYSDSKITHYEEPNYGLVNSPYRAITGSVIGQKYGYVAERLFIDEEEVRNSPTQIFSNQRAEMGDIKYKDMNKDGVINYLDQVALGHPESPQMTFGAGFSAGYKNFDFSIFFQGNANVSLFIDPYETSPFVEGIRKEDQTINGRVFNSYRFERALLQNFADNHWNESNPDPYAEYPRLSAYTNANNVQSSSYWMRDGSFLRLKQMEIGYNIRNFQNISNIRIYASGTNLLTWSKFKLWDPEMGGKGFGYPIQKVINFGVSVNL